MKILNNKSTSDINISVIVWNVVLPRPSSILKFLLLFIFLLGHSEIYFSYLTLRKSRVNANSVKYNKWINVKDNRKYIVRTKRAYLDILVDIRKIVRRKGGGGGIEGRFIKQINISWQFGTRVIPLAIYVSLAQNWAARGDEFSQSFFFLFGTWTASNDWWWPFRPRGRQFSSLLRWLHIFSSPWFTRKRGERERRVAIRRQTAV